MPTPNAIHQYLIRAQFHHPLEIPESQPLKGLDAIINYLCLQNFAQWSMEDRLLVLNLFRRQEASAARERIGALFHQTIQRIASLCQEQGVQSDEVNTIKNILTEVAPMSAAALHFEEGHTITHLLVAAYNAMHYALSINQLQEALDLYRLTTPLLEPQTGRFLAAGILNRWAEEWAPLERRQEAKRRCEDLLSFSPGDTRYYTLNLSGLNIRLPDVFSFPPFCHLTVLHAAQSILDPHIKLPPNLYFLDLSHTNGSTVPLDSICTLKNLRELRLANCGITDIPQDLCGLHNLDRLDLSDNPVNSLTKMMGLLRSLTTLHLDRTGISNLPHELAWCPRLTTITMEGLGPTLAESHQEVWRLRLARHWLLSDLTETLLTVEGAQITDLSDIFDAILSINLPPQEALLLVHAFERVKSQLQLSDTSEIFSFVADLSKDLQELDNMELFSLFTLLIYSITHLDPLPLALPNSSLSIHMNFETALRIALAEAEKVQNPEAIESLERLLNKPTLLPISYSDASIARSLSNSGTD